MLTDAQAARAMRHDMAAGEKCGPERIVSDRIVVARKEHPRCVICWGAIEKGTHNRVVAFVWDGEFMSGRACESCCVAMAEHDDGDAILNRYELGAARANGGVPDVSGGAQRAETDG